jgi:hypothetical protein
VRQVAGEKQVGLELRGTDFDLDDIVKRGASFRVLPDLLRGLFRLRLINPHLVTLQISFVLFLLTHIQI